MYPLKEEILQEIILFSKNQCNQPSPCDSFCLKKFVKKLRHCAADRKDLPKRSFCAWGKYTELQEKKPFSCQSLQACPDPVCFLTAFHALGKLRAGQALAARIFGSIDLLCLLLFPLPFKFPINALFSPEHLFKPREVGYLFVDRKCWHLTDEAWQVKG